MLRTLLLCLGIVFAILSTSTTSHAQMGAAALASGSSGSDAAQTAPADGPMTKEAADAMVARMSDDEVRQMLLDRLDAVAAAEAGAPKQSFFQKVNGVVVAFITPIISALTGFGTLIEMEARVLAQMHAQLGTVGIWTLIGMTILSLGIGLAAELAVRKGLAMRQGDVAPPAGDTLRDSVLYLARRLFRQLIGLIVFFVVARVVSVYLHSKVGLEIAHPFLLYMIMVPRLSATLTRFIFAPSYPELRLVNCSDHWAKYLQRNLTILMGLMGLTLFIPAINLAFGGHGGEGISLSYWMNLAVQLYLAYIAWTARDGLKDIIRGTDPDRTRFDEAMAKAYPYWIIGVDIFMWIVTTLAFGFGALALLGGGATYITLFWLAVLPALDTVIRGIVQHVVPPMSGDGAVARTAYRSAKLAYIRIGRTIMVILVLMIITGTWDMQLISFSGGVGPVAHFVNFLLTGAVGFIVYEAVSLYINRKLAAERTDSITLEEGGENPEGHASVGGEGGGQGTSRLATVLPLLRVIAQAGIIVLFTLLAIGNLGIDITPLLAGAGILGLAIGFGAQKLVSDIVSGVFFLIDDAFRIGEYIVVGSNMGTVEKISIRSMQLRHHRGILQTLPFGDISEVSNMSRDWVIMKLKFTVPFDTDPNKIKKIFKQIGKEIQEDPIASEGLMETFKSQGVFDFDDVGMIIRGKFTARPGTQFTIRKEVYNKVIKAFEENGIDFARREVHVALPEGFEPDTDKDAVVKAAAAEAARQASEPPAQG